MAADEELRGLKLFAGRTESWTEGFGAFAEGAEDPAEGADPFAGLDVPAPLEESLARHRRHLAELVRTMKTAGISEQQIEASVSALVDLYKAELIAAIRRLKG